MSDIQAIIPPGDGSKKPRQGRSPAFPFIPLNKALDRAEVFRVAEGGRPKHFSPLVSACRAWGVGVKTGVGIQTIAALGHFGLFEFEGSGEHRSARLTDLALRILLDKQPMSLERDGLIRSAALAPRIHAELRQKWPDGLPSDPTVETYLVRDRGFSESGARDLIAQFKETIAFAKLGQPDNIPADNTGGTPQREDQVEVETGDLVRVEIGGQDPFGKPVRIRAVQEHQGSLWVFVDDEETGIPMDQVRLAEKGAADLPKPALSPPRLALEKKSSSPPAAGMRQEVFALDEGDVVITFPDNLSAESFSDLQSYLEVFIKKMKRRAGVSNPREAVARPAGGEERLGATAAPQASPSDTQPNNPHMPSSTHILR